MGRTLLTMGSGSLSMVNCELTIANLLRMSIVNVHCQCPLFIVNDNVHFFPQFLGFAFLGIQTSQHFSSKHGPQFTHHLSLRAVRQGARRLLCEARRQP